MTEINRTSLLQLLYVVRKSLLVENKIANRRESELMNHPLYDGWVWKLPRQSILRFWNSTGLCLTSFLKSLFGSTESKKIELKIPEEIRDSMPLHFTWSKLIVFGWQFARNVDVLCHSLGLLLLLFLSPENSSMVNNTEPRWYGSNQMTHLADSDEEQSLHWIHSFCLCNWIFFGMIIKAMCDKVSLHPKVNWYSGSWCFLRARTTLLDSRLDLPAEAFLLD